MMKHHYIESVREICLLEEFLKLLFCQKLHLIQLISNALPGFFITFLAMLSAIFAEVFPKVSKNYKTSAFIVFSSTSIDLVVLHSVTLPTSKFRLVLILSETKFFAPD